MNASSLLYIPCNQCGFKLFTDRGSKMHATGICRLCREGIPRKSMPPKPKRKKDTSPNPYRVRPGQVWVSLDPRDEGREVTVLDVDSRSGLATVLSHGKGGDKRRQIKLTGFTRTKGRGYELRHDSSVGRAAAS